MEYNNVPNPRMKTAGLDHKLSKQKESWKDSPRVKARKNLCFFFSHPPPPPPPRIYVSDAELRMEKMLYNSLYHPTASLGPLTRGVRALQSIPRCGCLSATPCCVIRECVSWDVCEVQPTPELRMSSSHCPTISPQDTRSILQCSPTKGTVLICPEN